MKKGFSLVEVIISVTILSVVILALIKIKDNNIAFFNKFNNSVFLDNQIALGAIFTDLQKDEKIYFKDKLDFKDDEIRKQIKESVAEIKNEELDPIEIENGDYIIKINIIKSHISLKENGNKDFYTFRLEY